MSLRQSARFLAIFGLGLLACAPGYARQSSNSTQQAQSKANSATQPKVTSAQTVTVTPSPEDKEDERINGVYESVSTLEEQNDCQEAIQKFQTDVIPMAQKAQFEKPRNKFLFLSFRGIADCYLSEKRYAEAEQSYSKLFDYVTIWPGKDGTGYALIYQKIGISRMGQQDWKGAEDPLRRTVALLDQEMDREKKTDPQAATGPFAPEYGFVLSTTLNVLAVDLYRQGKPAEGLNLIERAYKLAVDSGVPTQQVSSIISGGLVLSLAAGDTAAMDKWNARAKAIK